MKKLSQKALKVVLRMGAETMPKQTWQEAA